jgi:dihydroxyacetone kinase-like protein
MCAQTLTTQDIIAAVEHVSDVIQLNESYLNELDAIVGDGEHGFNLNRAFARVKNKLAELSDNQISDLLRGIGMELIASGGGAGTTFYGTAFLAASKIAGNSEFIDKDTLEEMLSAALKDIRERGRASLGEKTMIDALQPAVEAFAEANKAENDLKEALLAAAAAARQGAILTKKMVGKKGRSLYSGERALGTPDPGAASTYLILAGFSGATVETPL